MNNKPRLLLYSLTIILLASLCACGNSGNGSPVEKTFDSDSINSISLKDPERALLLLDSAKLTRQIDDFEFNRLRSLIYFNGMDDANKALKYALDAYSLSSGCDNATTLLHLMDNIAHLYHIQGDYSRSIEFCTVGIKTAQDSVIPASEANLNLCLAQNLIMLHRKEEALSYFVKAIDILDAESREDNTYSASDDYAYALAVTTGALMNEGMTDEASHLLPRYEEAIDRLESKGDVPAGLADMRRASCYAMGAQLARLRGDADTASKLFSKLLSTKFAATPDACQLIIPHLFASGQYLEALKYLEKEKRSWQANTDTVSWGYVELQLKNELAAYQGLGDLRSANRVLNTIVTLSDTLRMRDNDMKALELAEIYRTNEQEMEIQKQSASLRIRNMIIISAAIFLILALISIIRMHYYNRAINNKNKTLVKTIDELMVFKERQVHNEEEIMRLRNLITKQGCGSPAVENDTDDSPHQDGKETTAGKEVSSTQQTDTDTTLTERDRLLYERMHHEVLARRLFLKPDLSRKSLLSEFHIPTNKFAAIFRQYAGCSFPQYINNCRLDYAVRLMHENPQWNMEAIAGEVGMSTSSFYSQFKKKFGMSPTDFKSNAASISSSDV